MNGKHLFLTSAGLTDKMKEKFFDIIGKCPKDVKVLYIPTAGIETDGARESLAICFHELFLMGIQYENILVYNLELILSKDYMPLVNVSSQNIFVLTFGYCVGKLPPYFMGGLIVYLSRLKGLYQVVG